MPARDHAPAFNSPAPATHNEPTGAPLPAIAPSPRTHSNVAPRANVGALARDHAPAFNGPGSEEPSAGQLNAGSGSRENGRVVNRALRKSPRVGQRTPLESGPGRPRRARQRSPCERQRRTRDDAQRAKPLDSGAERPTAPRIAPGAAVYFWLPPCSQRERNGSVCGAACERSR